MIQGDVTYKCYPADLTIVLYVDGREAYAIQCVNACHFYVVAFMASKLQQKESVDMSFFKKL